MIAMLSKLICEQYPNLPPGEPEHIAMQAKRGGTVWHDRKLPTKEKVRRSVIAWCRHRYTAYDWLLQLGLSKVQARKITQPQLTTMLERWQKN
jgi:hypothetical protein